MASERCATRCAGQRCRTHRGTHRLRQVRPRELAGLRQTLAVLPALPPRRRAVRRC
jgi:hypothetical protein